MLRRFPIVFWCAAIAVIVSRHAPAAPPFSGTIFIDPDIITPADPTTFQGAPYIGQGIRQMFDRRVNDWVNVNAYLFRASFDDGLTSEIQVNPEFGGSAAASVEALKYGAVLGRLPTALRTNMATVWIHLGTQPFGGGNNNVLIHTGQADVYAADGILEETLVHEASHTSLDGAHATSPGWLAAQTADAEFISTYARDNPTREDIAESFLPYLAVRYRSDRISPSLAETISRTIPNRIAYFDDQSFDLHPFVASQSQTLVAARSIWRYLDNGSNQGTAWRARTFNDSGWASGPTQLGYGDGDEATTVDCGPGAVGVCSPANGVNNNYVTTYFRQHFDIADPSLIQSLSLHVVRDDGVAVFLNGDDITDNTAADITLRNLPANAIFSTLAPNTIGNAAESEFVTFNVPATGLLAGDNVLAVEIHQQSAGSSDISFDLRLIATLKTLVPGDANQDGIVNAADLAVLVENLGTSSGALWIDGDFNADGQVGLSDAAILQSHWGQSAPIPAAVPEPSAMATLFVGIGCVLWRVFLGSGASSRRQGA